MSHEMSPIGGMPPPPPLPPVVPAPAEPPVIEPAAPPVGVAPPEPPEPPLGPVPAVPLKPDPALPATPAVPLLPPVVFPSSSATSFFPLQATTMAPPRTMANPSSRAKCGRMANLRKAPQRSPDPHARQRARTGARWAIFWMQQQGERLGKGF